MTLSRRRGYDLAVIGGGVAGLTAAWSAARHGLTTVLCESSGLFGGQIATLGELEDYPALSMTGVDLAATLLDKVRECGVAICEEEARSIGRQGRQFEVQLPSHSARANAVVIATGARLRKLQVPGAAELEGRGISQCATCDGPLFRDREVMVVGGGDAALQSALTLASGCRSVAVVVRSELKARQAFVDAAAGCPNLRFIWDCEVESVLGETTVTSVRLRNVRDGSTMEEACFAIFPLIGTTPNTELFAGTLSLTESGHIRTDERLQSSQPGTYAIGAVRDGHSGALVSAAGDAARAIDEIARQLSR